MTDEPFEVWEHRIDALLDRKLKPIKRNLQLLKKAYDTQSSQLLQTQKYIADFVVVYTQDDSTYMMGAHEIKNTHSVFPTFIKETTEAREDIYRSNNPLSVASTFRKKRLADLESLGIHFV